MYPALDQSGIEQFPETPTEEQAAYPTEEQAAYPTEQIETDISEEIDLLTEEHIQIPAKNITITQQALPNIHTNQTHYDSHTAEEHIEILNEEKDLDISSEDNRVQSPIEAADSLTSQWMEYAKDQHGIWKSSKETAPIGKVT